MIKTVYIIKCSLIFQTDVTGGDICKGTEVSLHRTGFAAGSITEQEKQAQWEVHESHIHNCVCAYHKWIL